jgi:hypothetical protein
VRARIAGALLLLLAAVAAVLVAGARAPAAPQPSRQAIAIGTGGAVAIAAPRASQRNSTSTNAEPRFVAQYGAELTSRFRQTIASTGTTEIGAVTGVEFLPNGELEAAAEPVRRGGGDAEVVCASGRQLPASDHARCAPTPTG